MRFCKEAMAVLGSIQFPDNVHKEQFEANARPFETDARSCETGARSCEAVQDLLKQVQDHVKQMGMAYCISADL